MKKASVAFTNRKTRSGHLFSIIYAEHKRIASQTVGKLYKCPDGNNAVSPTKCGNYEQSANGSERAYSGVQGCTITLERGKNEKTLLGFTRNRNGPCDLTGCMVSVWVWLYAHLRSSGQSGME